MRQIGWAAIYFLTVAWMVILALALVAAMLGLSR